MPENTKKLFLLDAFALIYRAYFAFGNNQRYNSKGLNTSTMLGFTNTLIEILEKQKPSHIAVVFDAPVATNRSLEFANYKANRQEMPEDIRKALPYVKQIIEAFKIPILLKDGFEADDVIGTMAKQAEKDGYTTYMMTPDKDFGQLVSENIFIYKPAAFGKPAEILGVKEVCEKFEVENPLQVIDILGLWGDAVDNIPGIPGIGEKTAKLLVKQYGSVENLIAHAHELKGKQQENVINFAEQGLLSKKLATIILDVPIDFSYKELELEEPDEEKITALFAELEFRNLAKRVLGREIQIAPTTTIGSTPINGQMDLFGSPVAQAEETKTQPQSTSDDLEVVEAGKNIENVPHTYSLIDTPQKRADLIKQLTAQKSFCFDTETTGLNAFEAELVGMSFAFKHHEAYYVPFSENQEETTHILKEFVPLFENETIEKIGQNIKYDINVLHKYGIRVKGKLFDTMIAHFLLEPDMRHSMDFLAEAYLGYKPVSIETLIGKKGKGQLNMRDVPIEKLVEYAAEDADITLQLKTYLEPKLTKELKEVFEKVETPLISVLAAMENEGIKLDVEALSTFSKELEILGTNLEKDILTLAGTKFNIDSPKQLGEVLFEYLKIIEKPKKTKTGQYATGEDELQKLMGKHDIIPKILEYRSVRKLKSTYVDALPELVSPKTGRIHTSYMQTVASTGRLSSTNPNLQNIPIRTQMGREIRKAFIAKNDDFTLLAADYSQIELRIIAALSGDQNMQKAFVNKEDIHAATAAKVFGVALADVDREMRSKAKAVNFGIIYGQSSFGLAQNLNISRGEAKDIIDAYFAQYPKIKAYMDNNIDFAKEHGYVETILHRRRYLKDINSANAIVRGHAERNAINAPIQGSAADVIKIAMINIFEEFKKQQFQSKMLLQVHDELVFDVFKPELETIKTIVKDKMENAVKLSVPLEVEMNSAKNWLEAH
ncbi:MAG: DNA polymerase I [Flavobacteriales bacterium]|nr:MAG: DNA polymerase I [Flavobacteriales bacterium]